MLSVNLTTFNRSAELNRCLSALSVQSDFIDELVIVDDHSICSNTEIIQKYEKIFKIKYIFNSKNMGNAYSRNVAMQHTSSEYIAFMDDDDIVLPGKFALVRQAMDRNCDMIFSAVTLKSDRGIHEAKYDFIDEGKLFTDIMSRNSIIYSASVVIKKSRMQEVGGFNESLRKGVDSFFYRKILSLKGIRVEYLPQSTLLVDETSSDSMTREKSLKNYYYSILSEFINIKHFWPYYRLSDFFRRFKKIIVLLLRILTLLFAK